MSTNAALWLAFHQAEDALLRAIEAPIPCAPVILEQPANRREARLRVQNTIEELSYALLEIGSAHKRLSEASVVVKLRIVQAQRLLSPIKCLPTEILLEIFTYILGPQDHGSIIKLSSVCNTWRCVILQQSALFTHADWSRWPTWLLKIWSSRAQSRLLTIEIGEYIEQKFEEAPGNQDFLTLLCETASKWRALRVAPLEVGQWVVPPWIVDCLLALPLLSLQTLHFDVGSSLILHDKGVSIPNISAIFVRGLYLRPSHSLSQLSALTITPRFGDAWSLWVGLLRLSSILAHLKIILNEELDVDTTGEYLALPALVSLTVVEGSPRTVRRFISIMDSSSFPNLRIIHMIGLIGPAQGPHNVLESLVSCDPLLNIYCHY